MDVWRGDGENDSGYEVFILGGAALARDMCISECLKLSVLEDVWKCIPISPVIAPSYAVHCSVTLHYTFSKFGVRNG
jgi:hypothetical protein